ncbi:hypothetical protein UPYG_G00332160 [Umbra pygmaea]|uniref:Uncharacterized protein n=1 Tax=Umbra pygmaea TaxID=75934 RepID=A0ABD0VZR4_UMBPY
MVGVVSPMGYGAHQKGLVGGASEQQQLFEVQQAQELQWNIAQVTQHMAGVNVYGANGMMGYGGQRMGGPTNQSTSQMMTSHIWK